MDSGGQRSLVGSERRPGAEPAGHGAYRELAPPPYLIDHVLCVWYRAPRATSASTAIIPDGCVDILWRAGESPVVAGPMTVPIHSVLQPGTGVVGVRFRPGAAAPVLGVDARELRDRHVPLRDVWPQPELAPLEADSVEGLLAEAVPAIARAVTRRLDRHAPDRFVIAAAAWLAAHPFGPVDALSQHSGLSERQVRRRFDQAIGYGPKMLQRVLRLQYLLWLAGHRRDHDLCLARLALAAGYADQPHMTREVVAFTGTSPRQLLLASVPHSAVSRLFLSGPPNWPCPECSPELP